MSPGLGSDPGELARRVEVGRHDGMARLEHVAPEGAGDVEQDAAADHGAETVDAAAGGAVGRDGRRRVPVVDDAAVAAVGEGVPVRGALGGQGEDVLAEADPLGLVGRDRLVDLDHGAARVDAALDESRLDPLRRRERQPEGERLAGGDGGGAPAPGGVIDQVEGADLVLRSPPPPLRTRPAIWRTRAGTGTRALTAGAGCPQPGGRRY